MNLVDDSEEDRRCAGFDDKPCNKECSQLSTRCTECDHEQRVRALVQKYSGFTDDDKQRRARENGKQAAEAKKQKHEPTDTTPQP